MLEEILGACVHLRRLYFKALLLELRHLLSKELLDFIGTDHHCYESQNVATTAVLNAFLDKDIYKFDRALSH